MKLVKELGVKAVGGSSKSFALYECPGCGIEIVCVKSNVSKSKTNTCRACADKATGEAKRKKAESVLLDAFTAVLEMCMTTLK